MAWNYRKRIKIAPGIHLNLSKGGVSTSIGPKGAKISIGKNGTYLNTSIPNTNEIEMFSPEEMQSPFETIKETDGEGHEWWNSRKLARLMGYQKYWNFERLIEKITLFLQKEKGLDLKEHIPQSFRLL